MAKDFKYIRKRKRKYGYAFLVDIPFVDETGSKKHFTQTVKVSEYGSEAAALVAAQRFRNEALKDLQAGKLKTVYPSVRDLYEKKFLLMPLAISTQDKQNSIFLRASVGLLDKPINKITSAEIQASVNAYAEDHTDDAVQRLVSIWRQIYKVCDILDYSVTDKTNALVTPKSKVVSTHRDVTMKAGELQITLDALLAYNARNGSEAYECRAIWYLLQIMYYTGCRPAEALALRRSDIHANFIDISKQIGSTSKAYRQEVTTKTVGSQRRLPIPPSLQPILDQLLLWSKYDLLLAKEDGSPQDISDIDNIISEVNRKTGLRFFPYKLRHQMSTDLMHRGDSVVARDLLGHTSSAMTLDYARSTDDQLYNAIKDRTLAENQPKTKKALPPSMDLNKWYALMRFKAALCLEMLRKAGIIDKKEKTA